MNGTQADTSSGRTPIDPVASSAATGATPEVERAPASSIPASCLPHVGPASDHLIVSHSPDVLFVFDHGGRLTRISPAIRSLTGLAPEELIGQRATAFAREDQRVHAEAALARTLAGEPAEFTGQVDTIDARDMWISVRSIPIVEADGSVSGGVGVAREVTDLKRAQAALEASEERYHLLAEHAGDVVLRGGPDKEIEWVSPSVTWVLGWSPEEVIGSTRDAFIHPDDLQSMASMRAGLFARNNPVAPHEPILARVRTKEGAYRWMQARISIVADADGRLTDVVTSMSDVDELVRTREEAIRATELHRATLDTLLDPYVVLEAVRDPHGRIVDFRHLDANEAACEYNECTRQRLLGRTIREHRPQDVEYNDQLIELFAAVVETGEPLALDGITFIARPGHREDRVFDMRAAKLRDGVVNTWRDVTERHLLEQHLSHIASHDPLTGLANRAVMLEELTRALSAGTRSRRGTGVIMLDIDRFKFVNDSLGHAAGDQLLVAAARRLEQAVRSGDLVARLGGDEFVVVMRDLTSPNEALAVAHRIVDSFQHAFEVDEHSFTTTASVGVTVGHHPDEPEALLREADAAMYRAKQSGRNRAATYGDELRTSSNERSALEAQLRPAMALGQLVVHYQPEVDLRDGRVTALHALLRWQHPSGELYPAQRFIDIAEDAGLIPEIGLWAIEESCRAMRSWAGTAGWEPPRLSLNLSKAQLADAGVVGRLEDIIATWGIDSSLVRVEVPEAALLRSGPSVSTHLARLHELGVRVVLDNFGRGDLALSVLRDYHVHAVNLDRTLVAEVTRDDAILRFVRGVTALADSIGIRVCGEGVETAEQAAVLAELGCSTARGYFYSHALPAEQVPAVVLQAAATRAGV